MEAGTHAEISSGRQIPTRLHGGLKGQLLPERREGVATFARIRLSATWTDTPLDEFF